MSFDQAIHAMLAAFASLAERLGTGTSYNPLSASTVQDPYPAYAALRSRSPVHRSRVMNAWLFTRHADVDTILRDHRRFGNDPRKGTLSSPQSARLPPPDEFTMLLLDPPDHTRLRSLVNKAFTSRAVNALEPRIRSVMNSLLDEIDDLEGFDLIEAIARPLPIIVIAEMLGIPARDRDLFKRWSIQRARLLEPTISRRERAIAFSTLEDFDAYFRAVIKKRRDQPRDDLVSALVQAQLDDDRLTERETLNMLRLLLIAGNETTTNLIGNGVLALLRHPDELERLRAKPELIPSAVEEVLRFDSPVQLDTRRVLADCEINGFALRKRDNVVLALGAANRDPEAFEQPDRLDVGRGARSHVSFGRGIHHCLGATLARLEGRIVLETLLERFARMQLLTDRPKFRRNVVLRGLNTLPVRCVRA